MRTIVIGILVVVAMVFSSCSSSSKPVTYGGTDPKGDYIIVTIDRDDKTILHQNITTAETHGPYSFVQETAVSANGGFSILNRIDLPTADGGGYVLFAEYPEAALVYQIFDATRKSKGNPVYAVYRQTVDKSSFYGKAYNWMKFFIDGSGSQDNMECGFAAFDEEGANGKLYGAAYSHRNEQEHTGTGFHNINEANLVSVNAMTNHSETLSNVMWQGTAGNWNQAIAIVGTPSGASILDFGPGVGGGGGLVLPQTNAVDNADSWWTTVAGTYLLLVYEADLLGSTKTVQPMKAVIANSHLKVYEFNDNTENATPVFDEDLVDMDHATGPDGSTLVSDYFATASGKAVATSSVVQNAHKAKGAFIARHDDPDGTNLIMTIFDPEGRFVGFTGFFNASGSNNDVVRFGFGIKDTGYKNAGL